MGKCDGGDLPVHRWFCPLRDPADGVDQVVGCGRRSGSWPIRALQRGLVTAPSKARRLVASIPASYAAFDVLAVGGIDLRT